MVWLFQYYIKYLALVFCIESIVYMVQYDILFVIIIVFWINETLYSDGTGSGFRKPVFKNPTEHHVLGFYWVSVDFFLTEQCQTLSVSNKVI